MRYLKKNLAERRLVGRESAWRWEFEQQPALRWLPLLIILAALAGMYLAVQNWIGNSGSLL